MKKDMNMTELLEAGKGTATCTKCDTNWKSEKMPVKCPFCDSKAILFVKGIY